MGYNFLYVIGVIINFKNGNKKIVFLDVIVFLSYNLYKEYKKKCVVYLIWIGIYMFLIWIIVYFIVYIVFIFIFIRFFWNIIDCNIYRNWKVENLCDLVKWFVCVWIW